ncbi:transposase [Cyanobacteria bacterium FACHB-63]|nr:transposase [Cyanobacteria bacterium FACHB-63]
MLETQAECIVLLEKIRWNGKPICPYCHSMNASSVKREQRYHCNECFTSYSVTVGTLFHKTHVELPKWFEAIRLIMDRSREVSIRQLATEIKVNKNTASYMISRIRDAAYKEPDFLFQILKEVQDFT